MLRQGAFLDVETVDNGDLELGALDRSLPGWNFYPQTLPDQLTERLAGCDVVVTNKVRLDAGVLADAEALKLVVVCATGVNVVDLDAAKARGITVCNIRDYCSQSVAQHVLASILNLVTGQPFYEQRVRNGEWRERGLFSLHDRAIRQVGDLSLGIIGYGTLGRAVGELARALGMNLLIGERRGRPARPERLSFRHLLQSADIISLHCPLTPETENMFDREALRAMKPRAMLINTARGGIVNARDLADALRAGEIAGAAVDVFTEEPPPADHPLLADDIPNLLLTPHNAWGSVRARQEAIDQVTAVIRSFERGVPVNRVV
ncbi:MAG: D-2-hydroxyacid dehydrogenase [Xanthomonadales bacterium]|jgi:glycerate dehydrogenase|nr:D-2-hydroxyacid dehydrogenase [Xanthomonadales bacterium]